ncbi:MAG: tetratricopeptide repeat protein, partial [Anaerolineaceae bacterium]
VRLLTRVAKLAPMDLSVRDMLIDLLISSGRMDEAVQQYMDIANVHYLLAELDLAREDYQKALSLSQKTVTSRTWAVQILNKLADIELQSLDLKQAIKILEQLRSLEPLDSTTRATLIDLYLRIGLPSGALNELDSFLKLLETAGHTDRSEHFLDALLEDRPDNIDIQKRLIRFFQNQNKQAEIIEKLDVLAEKCLRQENREGALATLQNLIALNPPNSNDYRRLYEELKNQKK